MKIFKNKKVIFESNNKYEVYNFLISKIKIKNFKQITTDMLNEISLFIVQNNELKWCDAKSAFSKLFNNSTSRQLEYWINRGWDINDAKKKISEYSKDASIKASIKISEMKQNPDIWNQFKATKPTTLEYYLLKGMNLEEATHALKERQSTFSKKKMIEQHGEYVGLKKVHDRNTKWLTSLRENNDWNEVSKMKAITLDKMIIKYGIEEGTEKYNNWKDSITQTEINFIKRYGLELGIEKWKEFKIKLINSYRYASKESISFFEPILEYIKDKIDESEIYIGINEKNEYWLKDNTKTFFYDLTIRSLSLIIEFHGCHIHPNPKWDHDKWNNWKHAFQNKNADEARSCDLAKKSLAESHGFKVIEVWNDDNLILIQNNIITEIENLL